MSINNITFLDDLLKGDQTSIFYLSESNFKRFYFSDKLEVTKFLNGLKDNKNYVVNLDFISNWSAYEIGEPTIILSKPFIVTNQSNSELISKFIHDRIYKACESYYLSDLHLEYDSPGVLVRYKEINIF